MPATAVSSDKASERADLDNALAPRRRHCLVRFLNASSLGRRGARSNGLDAGSRERTGCRACAASSLDAATFSLMRSTFARNHCVRIPVHSRYELLSLRP